MRKLVFLLTLAVAGCGPRVTPNADPVDVSGTVTAAGKPVNGIVLNFQPTSPGSLPASVPVTAGEFNAKITPGRYTYYVTRGASAESLADIPEKYAEGSMDRQIDVAQGAKLILPLE